MAKNTEGGRTMRRVFLPTLTILVVFSLGVVFSGCSGNVSVLDEREIEGVINRYINAIYSKQYNEAKACLYPGGPTDRNFDVVWNQTIASLSELERLYGCQTPVATMEITNITMSGDTAIARLGDVTICFVCTIIGPYCDTLSMYAGKEIPLRKYGGEWRIY
jgi:hypothetical protein